MLIKALRRFVGSTRSRLYDLLHNVRTQGTVRLDGLTITGTNRRHGEEYQPSHPKYLREVIGSLGIDYGRYTFIDLGSGKGRPILVASEFPFQRIIGVEFARELHDIACMNIKRFRNARQKCVDVQSIHLDATRFTFPETPLVLFAFNPFGKEVLAEVLRNLEQSVQANPRDVMLVYVSPFHAAIVPEETSMTLVETSAYHRKYRYPSVTKTVPGVPELATRVAPGH